LKYSRWVQVTLVPNEQGETLVRAMVEHFAAWGALPLLAVFGRPKTIALSWNKDSTVIEWNPIFGNLGLAVELCWPRSPEQKGSVENLVGWVKGSFEGHFALGDKTRCHPLTLTDHATRYLLKCEGLAKADDAAVHPHFERAFHEFGPEYGPTPALLLRRPGSAASQRYPSGEVEAPHAILGRPEQNGRHERKELRFEKKR
jgi:hypothetical protein